MAAALLTAFLGNASAAIITYSNQASFQAALNGSFTLANLDASPLLTFAPGSRVNDPGLGGAFASLGMDFVGPYNAATRAGDDGAIAVPGRDRLLLNGNGFGGEIQINFLAPVNGFGVFSNFIDGGQVLAYSGADLTGTLLGAVAFGNGGFGGLTSTVAIGSVRLTCERDQDLRCGVIDLQHGTFAAVASVPAPHTPALLLTGLAVLGVMARRRSAKS
jgi:hypothetical protein